MRAREGQGTFRANLESAAGIRKHLGPEGLGRCFDLDRQLRHVDRIFTRVFGEAGESRGSVG